MSLTNEKVLIAIASYLKQIGYLFDVSAFIQENKEVAESLINLFITRFSSKVTNLPKIDFSKLNENHKKTAVIIENLISKAIVRTNFLLKKPYLSFKIDLSLFDQTFFTLPKPLTFREIFVFSEEFEAIHLRNGKIARGGLRWSDRKDDFRTEVLGLVKTQNTKNTIIVPVGSKGGFVLKGENSVDFAKKCYRQFLSGLLDITDNVVLGDVKTPENVVIYDKEDAYLAVAADKGTASFSDIANEISKEYNFWLGDAFASGGSNGYDHKKMAITSRGAWVCVQRHFREIGIDVSKQEFTVVGIGDMSGDVFGNGMLRSEKIKLIAAFNHMNIFIDPNPDAETSFKERKRLFEMPTSTWESYDKSKMSRGGKIFKRTDKACELTPEIMSAFGISASSLSPEDLIKAILKSKFDLLWNGGIGTYVKASFEENSKIGDKANDSLRINGKELGAKIVGEGGNLGFSQKGRVEFALSGGRINTDAIDNSAGVDCSDHEVNIKILLNQLVGMEKITLEERNLMIRRMENEVADLVLIDNYMQSLALSLEEMKENGERLYPHFINHLEQNAGLERENEQLPSNSEIEERYKNNKKLTRSEVAILLAYAKMESYNVLISSEIINDPYCEKFLIEYFPAEMKQNLLSEIKSHKLRKEIIATVISNRFVNFAGITFGFEALIASQKSILQVIKAFLIIENIIDLQKVFDDMKNSDYKIDPKKQYKTLNVTREKILMPSVLKVLNEMKGLEIQKEIDLFKEKIAKF